MMDKPDVDQIEGLSPAISIEQKATSHNPRSTVGTVTEIYDYLRLLFARIGTPICPDHNEELKAKTVSEICDVLLESRLGTKVMVLSPIIRGKKGEHLSTYEDLKRNGYVRVIVNGVIYPIEEFPELEKNKKHDISVILDRLILKEGDKNRSRLAESIESALNLSGGLVEISINDSETDLFSATVLTITPKFFGLIDFIKLISRILSSRFVIFFDTLIVSEKETKIKYLPARESSVVTLGPFVEIGSFTT